MGAELSSIIDDLSALKHEERQEAAEKWLEVSHDKNCSKALLIV
jgi:hypothetical protein